MANYCSPLDEVFLALGDPTRRAIVSRLGTGAASVKELAAPFAMALPSFMKHLGVLERSGLIRSKKQGRIRTCELEPATLRTAETWMAEQRAMWESRSDRLAAYVESLHAKEKTNGH
ncbi:MAG: transcriptional regulator, ArsR family [Hydrocarboniphaga sp.]|uniref:ArsR/SmtB family transcription factor n=1 Tax=Hydrocarboniphaga sp. TaxID=2033016 RepID=UPI00262C2F8F|nr:metalloregulator ArsR/SmtB family transcription factor [Hydrocarboniphaga sp.]MDB5970221.1 transcriptional regulator, ArsR family [Hydrocarboniphaga sp.]